jgi:hypothetical protein
MPHDHHPHHQYYKWLVWEHKYDLSFVKQILWMDEAAFTHECVFNSYSSHW